MDGVLHNQDNTESLEGALQDICLTDGCGGGREDGGMRPIDNGFADGEKGPLQADIDIETMGALLLKKRGVRVACGDGMWINSFPLG